jgi:GNAT superfamily N-acetyltransferase
MAMHVRQLTPADAAALEDFLVARRDSSMFLRANSRRGGLAYDGKIFQAIYAAAFRDERIVAVAAHCWNGMMLVQAPDECEAVATACVKFSGQNVTGFAGPLDHVCCARAALGLADAPAALDGSEWLYALDLTQFEVPAALADAVRACRAPRPAERDLLCAWRLAYDIETLGATDTEEQRRRSAEFLDAQIAEGNAWLAFAAGAPVSLSALNAALPDIVQLGGIYTPPHLRGRGYAKVSVAATLVASRERGASRAVLFTKNPSAERCYEALGFRRIGDYALVILRRAN